MSAADTAAGGADDATASPPPHDVARVVAADGAEADLALRVPAGARLGLLWLPALGVAARHYAPFADALAAHGIASALHEWRGAGSSSLRADRRHDWGYRELLELDVPASLAAARARDPGVRWLVGGHSLGSQLAALTLALAPDALEGLVIVAGGAPAWRTFPRRERWLVRAAFPLVRAIVAVVGHYPGKRIGFGGTEARGVMRDWSRTGSTGRYAPRAISTDLEAALAAVRKPVLALRLQRDRLTPRASLAYLLAKMPCAPTLGRELGAEAFPSGEASHFSWLREPAPVAQAIVDGFASLGVSREQEPPPPVEKRAARKRTIRATAASAAAEPKPRRPRKPRIPPP